MGALCCIADDKLQQSYITTTDCSLHFKEVFKMFIIINYLMIIVLLVYSIYFALFSFFELCKLRRNPNPKYIINDKRFKDVEKQKTQKMFKAIVR